MKYLLFLVFSSMESFSIVMLGLILFRFRINYNNAKNALFVGVCLSLVSLINTLLNLEDISPFIQMIVMYVLMLILFKNKPLYTLLISVVPYIIYGFIQAAFIFTLDYFKLATLESIKPFTSIGNYVQFFTFLITFAVMFVIRKTNEGYAFVPEDSMKAKYKYSNLLFKIVLITSVLLLSVNFYLYKTHVNTLLFEVFLALVSLLMFITLYISLNRDKEESQ